MIKFKEMTILSIALVLMSVLFADKPTNKDKQLAKMKKKIHKIESELSDLKRLYQSFLDIDAQNSSAQAPKAVKAAVKELDDEAKAIATQSSLKELEEAIQRCIRFDQKLPDSIDYLVQRKFILKAPKDAWGKPLVYQKTFNEKGYLCCSNGADGKTTITYDRSKLAASLTSGK